MTKFFFAVLLLAFNAQALEVQINSDKYSEISHKLNLDENINKIIRERKVPYSTFDERTTNNFNNSSNRNMTHKEYAKLKMLLVSLPKDTHKNEIKDALRTAFFKQYETKKEEFSFVYKISYPNNLGLRGDDVLEGLQKKISIYILNKYGISNIEDNTILHNNHMTSSTKNYTLGTTESNYLNNFDNSYKYTQDRTTRTGVVSFIFYPFVMIKRNHNKVSNDFTTKNKNITTEFAEIEEKDSSNNSNIKFALDPEDKQKIDEFISQYTKSYSVDVSQSINKISNKILKYNKLAKSLFDAYPECNTLGCLDQTISKKLNSYSSFKKKKIYTYNIDLARDDDFEYLVTGAYRKVEKYLRRDTQVSSLENTEMISGNNYSKNTMASKFIPVVQTVIATPYIKESNRLGLHFKITVSFEESNLCSQYFAGFSRDTLYGMKFIQLKSDDGIIEVAQTELTNKIFSKIYPRAKKDKYCESTKGPNKPVNCLSLTLLDNFLKKINKKSTKYKYRFFTCKEALFFATCGGKQKYCWGNKSNYNEFTFLRSDRHDYRIKNVAFKKSNSLNLYDLCGNSYEYCTNPSGWYRTYGSMANSLKPRILRDSYPDVNTIRLVREKL